MPPTPSRQRNSVSAGTALGLITQGRTTIPFNKFTVDLSFESAWNKWKYRSNFPQISTDIKNGSSGSLVLTHASSSKNTGMLYWTHNGNEISIHMRDSDWDPSCNEEVTYALSRIDGSVPLEGWKLLAGTLLSEMGL